MRMVIWAICISFVVVLLSIRAVLRTIAEARETEGLRKLTEQMKNRKRAE